MGEKHVRRERETYEGRKKCMQCLVGKLKEGNAVEDPNVGKRIILQWNLSDQHRVMDCIRMAQEREMWQAVNTVLKCGRQ